MSPGCDNGMDDHDLDVDVDAGGGGWQGWLWIFPRRRSIPSNEGSRPFRPIYQSPPRAIPTHHPPIPFQLPQPLSAFSRGPLLMLMLTECCCCHPLSNQYQLLSWFLNLAKATSYFCWVQPFRKIPDHCWQIPG